MESFLKRDQEWMIAGAVRDTDDWRWGRVQAQTKRGPLRILNKTDQIRKYRIRLAQALGRFWATSVQILSYLRINATFFCRELALMRSWGARSLCFREPFTRWKYGIDSRIIVLIGSCFWRKLVLKSSFTRTSENNRDVIGWHSIKSRTAWILRFVCCLIFWFY